MRRRVWMVALLVGCSGKVDSAAEIDASDETGIVADADSAIDAVVDVVTDSTTTDDTTSDTASDSSTDTALDSSTETALDSSTETALDSSTDTSPDAPTVTTGSGSGYTYACLDGQAYALVPQASGKVVLAGESTLVRLLPSGAIDTTFGSGGVSSVTTPGKAVGIHAAIRLSTGAIVVGGTAGASSGVIARLTADGAIDTTFATSGFAFPKLGTFPNYVEALAASIDRIFVGGMYGTGAGKAKAFIHRYTPSGLLEGSFAFHYDTPPDMGLAQNSRLWAMALQSDGKVVVAGSAEFSSAVARFLADGTPDSTFGAGGYLVFNAGKSATATSSLKSLAIQSSGAILVAGASDDGTFVARITSAGALDGTFGTAGVLYVDSLASSPLMLVQSDDAFVMGWPTTTNPFDLERRTKNSPLDVTFGTAGKLTTTFGGATGFGFALDRTGGKLIVGITLDTPRRQCLVRYDVAAP